MRQIITFHPELAFLALAALSLTANTHAPTRTKITQGRPASTNRAPSVLIYSLRTTEGMMPQAVSKPSQVQWSLVHVTAPIGQNIPDTYYVT